MTSIYPPLVAIRLSEWNQILHYAETHDIERGTTDLDCYDAQVGGFLQVLTIRSNHTGPARVGDLRVMYTADRADGIYAHENIADHATHPLPPEIQQQLRTLEGEEVVIVRVPDGDSNLDNPEEDTVSMTIGEATRFFHELYRTVIGHPCT
ncbi:MAG: hypothetical protein ABL983_02415 [Nitrospira sp.]